MNFLTSGLCVSEMPIAKTSLSGLCLSFIFLTVCMMTKYDPSYETPDVAFHSATPTS